MKEYGVKYSMMEKITRGPDVFWRDFPKGSEHIKTAYYMAESADEAVDKLKSDFGMFKLSIHSEPTYVELTEEEYESR